MDVEEVLLTTCDSNKPFAACIFNPKNGSTIHQYKNGCAIGLNTLSILRNDYILGGNAKESKLCLWPINNHDITKKVRLILPEPANCLAVCPNFCYLAIGIKTKLHIWQLASGQLLCIQKKNFQPINVVKFSSDGNFVVTGGQEGMINTYRLADLVDLQKTRVNQNKIGEVEPLYTRTHHTMPIMDIFVTCFGSKARFATASVDHSCKIYNLYNGELMLNLIFPCPLYSVIFDSMCWQLFVGTSTGAIYFFSLKDTPRIIDHHIGHSESNKSSQLFIGHDDKVRCLDLNMSNTILASGSDDKSMIIWEIQSKQVLKRIVHVGSITNLRFMLKHENILKQNFKPTVSIQHLEMNMNSDNDNFPVTVIQTVDITKIQEDYKELQKHIMEGIEKENRYLRAMNKQLFDAALEIAGLDPSTKSPVQNNIQHT